MGAPRNADAAKPFALAQSWRGTRSPSIARPRDFRPQGMKRSASCPVPQTRQSDGGSETKKGRRSGPRSVGSKSWTFFFPRSRYGLCVPGNPVPRGLCPAAAKTADGAPAVCSHVSRGSESVHECRNGCGGSGDVLHDPSVSRTSANAVCSQGALGPPPQRRSRSASHLVIAPPLTWASEASTRRSVPERLRGGGDALCVRSVSRTSAEASCSHGTPKSAAVSSSGRPFLGSVALDARAVRASMASAQLRWQRRCLARSDRVHGVRIRL